MQQVDAKAGVAHVELLHKDQDETAVEDAEGQEVETAPTAGAPVGGQESAAADADGSRVFFLLKVRAVTRITAKTKMMILRIFWSPWCSGRLRRIRT